MFWAKVTLHKTFYINLFRSYPTGYVQVKRKVGSISVSLSMCDDGLFLSNNHRLPCRTILHRWWETTVPWHPRSVYLYRSHRIECIYATVLPTEYPSFPLKEADVVLRRLPNISFYVAVWKLGYTIYGDTKRVWSWIVAEAHEIAEWICYWLLFSIGVEKKTADIFFSLPSYI